MKSIADFEFNGAPLLSGIMLVLKLSVRILTGKRQKHTSMNLSVRPVNASRRIPTNIPVYRP